MLDSYYRLKVPADLAAHYRVTNVISLGAEWNKNFRSDLVIERDAAGCVSTVKYFTPDRELAKVVCYKGSDISQINYYRNKVLYASEEYKEGHVYLKTIYRQNREIAYRYEYEYDKKGRIISISKKVGSRDILAVYKYDDFGRIIRRKLYLNSEKVLEQQFGYDILDRITAYTDDNMRIVVKKFNKKNELISYVITDKIGNDIRIENDFIGENYRYSQVTINGYSSTIKDVSYMDNVMLKKPYTSEDDLDLIIANLLGCSAQPETMLEKSPEKIFNNIELRALPISIRKRILYNKTVSKVS